MTETSILMPRDLDEMDNRHLTTTVSDQETLEAFKHLLVLKAPGPDDIHSFYHQCWNIIVNQ